LMEISKDDRIVQQYLSDEILYSQDLRQRRREMNVELILMYVFDFITIII